MPKRAVNSMAWEVLTMAPRMSVSYTHLTLPTTSRV